MAGPGWQTLQRPMGCYGNPNLEDLFFFTSTELLVTGGLGWSAQRGGGGFRAGRWGSDSGAVAELQGQLPASFCYPGWKPAHSWGEDNVLGLYPWSSGSPS